MRLADTATLFIASALWLCIHNDDTRLATHRSSHKPRGGTMLPAIFATLYAAVLLATAIVSGFAILSNDSFGLRYQADHLKLSEPTSFYNAFFPIGYPLILRLCGWVAGSPFTLATILQIVCAGLFAFYAYRIAISILPRTAALVATVAIVMLPGIVRAELSVVPDFLTAFFVLLAVFDLFEARPLKVGMWLGIAMLFRFHAVAIAVALILALGLLTRERRAMGRLLLGVLPFALLALGVGLWATPALHATSGVAFNVWKTMHGVDWSNTPHVFDRSLYDVVRAEPGLFVSSYFDGLLDTWFIWLPFVIFLLVSSRKPVAATVRAVMLAALLYHLFTIPGGSARGPLLIAPLSVLAAIWSLLTLMPFPIEAKPVRRMIVAAVTGFSAVGVGFMVLSAFGSRERIESYDQLARALGLHSERDAATLYSDDFALYFPTLRDATPRFSGGWPELGLPGYAAEYPHIPDRTAIVFYTALKENGIKHLAFRARALNPRALALAANDTLHFSARDVIATYHVFDVK